MQEGMYLGSPPVRIGTSRAHAVLASMMRGGASYANAAGGFGQPLAMPQLQGGLKPMPANPQSSIDRIGLYPISNPSLFKQYLRRRFGSA